MDLIRFAGTVRYWDPAKGSGLAVVDIPNEHVPALGGLKQQRVRGSLAGAEFASNVMPAGAGRLALSVSKAMMATAHVTVGDEADVEISEVGKGSPKAHTHALSSAVGQLAFTPGRRGSARPKRGVQVLLPQRQSARRHQP